MASIAAAYTGPAPIDAASTPNYQIQLNISQVSIYGMNYSGFTASTLAFTETTAGHMANSPAINLISADPANDVSNYTKLLWNPEDFAELGFSSTRTFMLLAEDESPVDGFEIFGTITLTYDAMVPEPSSMLMLGMGTLLLSMRRRQNRSRSITA
jgi:hypothetical protein